MLPLTIANLGRVLINGTRLVLQGFLQISHLTVILGQQRRDLSALRPLRILRPVNSKPELALNLLQLLFVRSSETVPVVQCTVTLTDHISQFQVLRLELALKLLPAVYSLLRRGGLDLEALGCLQKIQVLVTELRVQLGQSFIFGTPCVDLLLQGPDLLVARGVLHVRVRYELVHLLFQILHTTVIFLQHELVPLKLCARVEVLALKLGQATLCMRLVLLLHELLLGQTRLLRLQTLLFLKIVLCLLLHEELLSLLIFPLLLKTRLLCLILLLLTLGFGAPEVVDGLGLDGARLRWRRWLPLHLLCWSPGKSWPVIVLGQQVRRVLRQLRDSNKTGKVAQV